MDERQELKRFVEGIQQFHDSLVTGIKLKREVDIESIERQLSSEEPNLLHQYMKYSTTRDGRLDPSQLPHAMESITEKIKEKEAKLKHQCSLKSAHKELGICKALCMIQIAFAIVSPRFQDLIANPGPPREIRRYHAIMHLLDEEDIIDPEFDVAAANRVLVDVMENS